MLVLFRWLFTDGLASGVFERASGASFQSYTVPPLDPAFIRATEFSEPAIRVRDARGGLTL